MCQRVCLLSDPFEIMYNKYMIKKTKLFHITGNGDKINGQLFVAPNLKNGGQMKIRTKNEKYYQIIQNDEIIEQK